MLSFKSISIEESKVSWEIAKDSDSTPIYSTLLSCNCNERIERHSRLIKLKDKQITPSEWISLHLRFKASSSKFVS